MQTKLSGFYNPLWDVLALLPNFKQIYSLYSGLHVKYPVSIFGYIVIGFENGPWNVLEKITCRFPMKFTTWTLQLGMNVP